MDAEWSKREAVEGCNNCWSKPDQVAVIKCGGLIIRFCIDCINELNNTSLTLIDEYDGYDDGDSE